MLTITIPEAEYFDEQSDRFVILNKGGCRVTLEHSLASVSKWEAKNKKPFLGMPGKTEEKTEAEMLEYISDMAEGKISDEALLSLKSNPEVVQKIKEYIDDSQTATWFHERENQKKGDRKVITAEVIYDWMMSLGIWPECQYWHLNRLFVLIRVRSDSQNPDKKKMKHRDLMRSNAELNRARHARHGVR